MRVERHDRRASRPRKARQRDDGAERNADQRPPARRSAEADGKRQPHDGEQRGVAGQDQLERGGILDASPEDCTGNPFSSLPNPEEHASMRPLDSTHCAAHSRLRLWGGRKRLAFRGLQAC